MLTFFLLCLSLLIFIEAKVVPQVHPIMHCRMEYQDKCLPDLSGFYRCKFKNRKYKPFLHKICTGEKSTCKCFETKDQSRCRCARPVEPPSFPATGVIRWNGTRVVETYYGKKTYLMEGEVQKNKNGQFIRKWRDDDVQPYKFEIISLNADGNAYTKVTGGTSTRSCSTSPTSHGGELSSIWKNKENYDLRSSIEKKHQIWKGYEEATSKYPVVWDTLVHSSWHVIFDNKSETAIPKMFRLRVSDGFAEYWESIDIDYSFSEISKENKLSIDQFCNNES